MQRIEAATAAVLRVTLYDANGTETAAGGAVTVTITDAAGNAVKTDAAADLVDGSVGTYAVTLDNDDVPDPTRLTAVWSDAGSIVATTVVDVAGGRYVRLGDVRSGHTDTATYPTSLLEEVIAGVEDKIDEATGVAWVPRYASVRVRNTHEGMVRLPHLQVREIISATYNGEAVGVSGWKLRTAGVVLLDAAYQGPLEVAYLHGYDAPPPGLAEAATVAANTRADERGAGNRRGRVEIPGDGFPIQTASLRHGRPFGIDGVDSIVMAHDHRPAV